MAPESLLAAVDLGSNSFRLEIGRVGSHQRIERVEYLKETVRQGNGLNSRHELSQDAMQRGWECLARFGERLRGFAPAHVRAVATQTLREACNADDFVRRGSELLGFPIAIIPGEEEARLIYRGVSSSLPPSQNRRLVIDIGGRSTEIIIGQQSQTLQLASFALGSVSWSNRFFADGALSKSNFAQAVAAAKQALGQARFAYPGTAWDCAYASSGTANAVGDALTAQGMDGKVITLRKLRHLYDQLLEIGHVDKLRIPGLKEDRRPVVAGGISVMLAVVELLDINELEVAQGALRQGVLHDLLDHEPPADKELAEIQALQQDFGIDTGHAQRVERIAMQLWQAIEPENAPQGSSQALHIATQLHEVGMRVALSNYHRHGAYITEHCGLATWEPALRQRVTQLVLGHQGKLRKLEDAIEEPGLALPLMALRIAVQLCHTRRDPDIAGLQLKRAGTECKLSTPQGWMLAYPQSARLLEEEAMAWSKTPWSLRLQLR
ncbi:MAG: Ppx/GppA family phosphatase [Comamonas sp.]|jgi:exopolyphosphatase/guanosine-5'-triphosphate,3'-diphosphate pyrophosphatase|uniref:Ppx/GppA phosphatase family protein n=1 Tax=Comamonas sp. TaxID=34028 RepID=UPI0028365E8E|nr:Ppx/GppA phosphatase family protein [Comamonas sp.]MDR0214966.1 Ppx/GppA family phosphatase [Comamonas sp.]